MHMTFKIAVIQNQHFKDTDQILKYFKLSKFTVKIKYDFNKNFKIFCNISKS